MQINHEFFIVKWDVESVDPYLYGTDLKLLYNNVVQFRNLYIPSGTVMQSWCSRIAFHSQRRSNNLPRLERNKRYKISYHIKTTPENSTYLKLDLIDIMNDVVETHIIKQGEELEFTIPESLLMYNIYLMSAGCNAIQFDEIIIKSSDIPSFSVDNYWVDRIQNSATKETIQVIFIEPLYQRIGMLTPSELSLLDQAILVNSGYEDAKLYMNDDLFQKIEHLVKQSGVKQIEYIGYGPISNFAALMYAELTPNSIAKVTDEFYTIDQYRDIIEYHDLTNISVKKILLERYNTAKVTLYSTKQSHLQLDVTRFHNPSYHVKDMI